MNTKNIIAVGLAGALLLGLGLGVGFLVGGNNQSDQNLGGNGTRFPNGLSTTSTSPVDGEVRTATLTVTGVSTLTGAVSFAGVVQTPKSSSLNNASSTICSFTSPAATSTLQMGSVAITTATSTAIAIEIAKASTLNATTTRLSYIATLAANSKLTLNTFVASTTLTFGALQQQNTADPYDMVFGPNQFLNVKIGGAGLGTLGANTLVGTCKAIFITN